jgi:hypothetical protein
MARREKRAWLGGRGNDDIERKRGWVGYTRHILRVGERISRQCRMRAYMRTISMSMSLDKMSGDPINGNLRSFMEGDGRFVVKETESHHSGWCIQSRYLQRIKNKLHKLLNSETGLACSHMRCTCMQVPSCPEKLLSLV